MRVGEHHPAEQGLRPAEVAATAIDAASVGEHHPAEQGLRPLRSSSDRERKEIRRRASSSRTRIKTPHNYLSLRMSSRRRASSSRTRIKTPFAPTFSAIAEIVGEHHPAEQGLRLAEILNKDSILMFVGEHHPAEQGLRPSPTLARCGWRCVGEHHPAEQGLRHDYFLTVISLKLSESIIQQNKD